MHSEIRSTAGLCRLAESAPGSRSYTIAPSRFSSSRKLNRISSTTGIIVIIGVPSVGLLFFVHRNNNTTKKNHPTNCNYHSLRLSRSDTRLRFYPWGCPDNIPANAIPDCFCYCLFFFLHRCLLFISISSCWWWAFQFQVCWQTQPPLKCTIIVWAPYPLESNASMARRDINFKLNRIENLLKSVHRITQPVSHIRQPPSTKILPFTMGVYILHNGCLGYFVS